MIDNCADDWRIAMTWQRLMQVSYTQFGLVTIWFGRYLILQIFGFTDIWFGKYLDW